MQQGFWWWANTCCGWAKVSRRSHYWAVEGLFIVKLVVFCLQFGHASILNECSWWLGDSSEALIAVVLQQSPWHHWLNDIAIAWRSFEANCHRCISRVCICQTLLHSQALNTGLSSRGLQLGLGEPRVELLNIISHFLHICGLDVISWQWGWAFIEAKASLATLNAVPVHSLLIGPLIVLHLPILQSNMCWVCASVQELITWWTDVVTWIHSFQCLCACKICWAQPLHVLLAPFNRLDWLQLFHNLWFLLPNHVCNLGNVDSLTLQVGTKCLPIGSSVAHFSSHSCIAQDAIPLNTVEVGVSWFTVTNLSLLRNYHVNRIPITSALVLCLGIILVCCLWRD